jgi:4'-phosphopantetheinyl transferase
MIRIFAVKLMEEQQFVALHERLAQINPTHFFNMKSKFKNMLAMQHHLLGGLLVKSVAISKFGFSRTETSLAYGENSKPFFNLRSSLHFNVSHSGQWVVAAFSDKPVGIDVEKIRDVNLQIAHRFFSPEEISFLMRTPGQRRKSCFFDFWTLKESYLKAIGTGLTRPLSSFTISYSGNKIHLDESGKPVDVCLSHLDLEEGYVLSVCAGETIGNKEIEIITFDDLLAFYGD